MPASCKAEATGVVDHLQVKAIAHAHVKTDKIDAGVLASLHAAGFLPEVWLPDAETERRRRLVARRNQIVRHRTRVKNETHAILAAHLVPPCPHAELFNQPGRDWLARQVLPDDERAAIARHLRELDRLGEDLAVLDRGIAEATVDDPAVRRLLTIAGVNVTVAAGLVAAIGDIRRFSSPQKLVSYFGLNPRVRQSGLGFAQHGRISKIGRAHARALLVEAAWAAAKAPGPLHAFFLRIRARRGHQIAAVATARKMAVLVWHLLAKETDYLWARPALVAHKLRALELQADRPMKKGNKRGPAYAYNVKALRNQEMVIAERARLSALRGPVATQAGAEASRRRDHGCMIARRASPASLKGARRAALAQQLPTAFGHTGCKPVHRCTGAATAAVHPDQAARRGSQPPPRSLPRGRPCDDIIAPADTKHLSISSVVRTCFQCAAGKS